MSIALQFSGGKDSLALLVYLRPVWDKLTVYYCNSGAALQETLDVVEQVRASVPKFVEVAGRQPEVLKKAWPTDIVPVEVSEVGLWVDNKTQPMIDRYTCCFNSMILPLHERMVADGVTVVLRGQRNEDAVRSPVEGKWPGAPYAVEYPIKDWTLEKVLRTIEESEFSLPGYYKNTQHGIDCKTCTAWLEHGALPYIRQHYPQEWAVIQPRLQMMAKLILPRARALESFAEAK